MLTTRCARYLRSEKGVTRIRQRFVALSSSAKDEDADEPSPTPAQKAEKQLAYRRNPTVKKTGSNAQMNRIMSDFFASSPTKTGLGSRYSSPSPSSSSTTKDSVLKGDSMLKGFRSQRQDRGSQGFSRFSRDRETTQIMPGSLREKFLPDSKGKPEEVVQSILRTSTKPALTSDPTTNMDSSATKRSDPSDVRLLRSALFGGEKDKQGLFYLKDASSPLSEIIAAMRATKEKQRQGAKESTHSVTPKWRATGGRRLMREEDVATRQATRDSISRLEERVRQQTGKSSDKGSQASKVILIPSYEMNLTEVSQLLRISTRRLRRSLRSLGELPDGRLDDEKIILRTEIVEYIALDLGIDCERSDNSIQSDQEVLLQRRALAEQAVDAYENFPPRPPVVTIMVSAD